MAITTSNHLLVRERAIAWARELLKQEFVVLDTETTALDHTGEVVQIAVVRHDRSVIINTFIKPFVEINEKSRAFEVSGISNKMVRDAPFFGDIWFNTSEKIGKTPIVAYNATYDKRIVGQSILMPAPVGSEYRDPHVWIDAMIPYSEFVGDWNSKYGSYKWQKLPGTQHGALADCLAVLDMLVMMANSAE